MIRQYAIAGGIVVGGVGVIFLLGTFAPVLLLAIVGVVVIGIFTYMLRDILEWNGFFKTKAQKQDSRALEERLDFNVVLAERFMAEDEARRNDPTYVWRTPEDIEDEVRLSMDYWGPR